MKAVAEATVNELKNRLKDRERMIAALRAKLDEDAAAALARHQEDRAEIERLNEKLFQRNDADIQDLKVGATAAGFANPALRRRSTRGPINMAC